MRTLGTLTLTALLVGALAAPASATTSPPSATSGAPGVRPAPHGVPLCVTTIWRSEHTGRPKTRPGEVCALTPSMWLPRSWRVLAHSTRGGVPVLIVQRPRA